MRVIVKAESIKGAIGWNLPSFYGPKAQLHLYTWQLQGPLGDLSTSSFPIGAFKDSITIFLSLFVFRERGREG